MNNNNLISKLQLLFYVCIENNIPILAWDNFLLGTIKHNGFMNTNIDSSIVICEKDKLKLENIQKLSNKFFTIKYHENNNNIFYIFHKNQIIAKGKILIDDIYSQSKSLFYGREVFVPKDYNNLIKESKSDKLIQDQNEIDNLYIYYKMIIYSGPHTNHINNNNSIRDKIELYSSFHLPKFTYNNALRNVLIQFKKYHIEDLAGKRVLDIGCNIGSVIFECLNRNASYVKGIEYNKNRVDICNDLAKYLDVEDKCSFECKDINEILSSDNSINTFIKENNNFDIIICKAVDAYIDDKKKFYKLIANLTNEICYFEVNSDISDKLFGSLMNLYGFMDIKLLGTINSDINKKMRSVGVTAASKRLLLYKQNMNKKLVGNNRKSYILKKLDTYSKDTKTIEKKENLYIYQYKNIKEFDSIKTYIDKIKDEKFIPDIEYRELGYTVPELKNQLSNSFFTEDEKLDIKNQIIEIVKNLNDKNISHRDIHTKNLFYQNNILYLIDYDFLTKDLNTIDKCYDLTGKNLNSPLNSQNMNILSDHLSSVKTFLKPIEIEIEDFL